MIISSSLTQNFIVSGTGDNTFCATTLRPPHDHLRQPNAKYNCLRNEHLLSWSNPQCVVSIKTSYHLFCMLLEIHPPVSWSHHQKDSTPHKMEYKWKWKIVFASGNKPISERLDCCFWIVDRETNLQYLEQLRDTARNTRDLIKQRATHYIDCYRVER